MIKKVCTRITAEKKSHTASNPNKNSSGTVTTAGILDYQAGSTASQCADIVLKILEERFAGILEDSTITTLGNNAVLIIDSVIRILVIRIIPRITLRRRRSF